MGSFIMINTDDLDSLKAALNTRVHRMCETSPIDAGERLMNVIDKFTSGSVDTSDDKSALPIDSVVFSEAAVCRIKDYTKCPLFQNYKEGCHTCNFKRQTDL
jgi:hypothetical protein